MAEVRTMREGTLRWVQASGSGVTWATASAPVSGILAYCQSFSWSSAADIQIISDRGIPDHNKLTNRQPIDITFQPLWTGAFISAASGSGASVPMVHLEYRASAAETPTTGVYAQFFGVPIASLKMTEQANGNTVDYTSKALAMNGPTASGYLS